MEKLNLDYLLKNIPIPSKTSYLLKLIEKIESVTKEKDLKALFFLNDGKDKSDDRPETFGSKSRKIPPSCTEMESFEKDLFNMKPSIKFKTTKNNFQLKLKEDVNKIRKSKNVFVFADKTNNLYEMTYEKYQELLQ